MLGSLFLSVLSACTFFLLIMGSKKLLLQEKKNKKKSLNKQENSAKCDITNNLNKTILSNESKQLFDCSQQLLTELMEKAKKTDAFANDGHYETFEKKLYNFRIHISVSPTQFEWKICDLSQKETNKSFVLYATSFNRSTNKIDYDEIRVYKGKTYDHGPLLNRENASTPFLSNLEHSFTQLNDAGWNRPSSPSLSFQPKEDGETSLIRDSISKIYALIHQKNRHVFDKKTIDLLTDIFTRSSSLLSAIENEELHELEHDIERMVSQELYDTLVHYCGIFRQYDDVGIIMLHETLESLQSFLSKKEEEVSQQHLIRLKETQRLIQHRYQ